jgi:hypothetical protein
MELSEKYPKPWTFDFFDHKAKQFASATIYAADSTRICQTKGEDAKQLAELIIQSVNAFES